MEISPRMFLSKLFTNFSNNSTKDCSCKSSKDECRNFIVPRIFFRALSRNLIINLLIKNVCQEATIYGCIHFLNILKMKEFPIMFAIWLFFFNFNVFVSCNDFSNSLSRLLVWSMYILDQKLKVTFSETDYFNHISPTSSFRSFKIFVHDLGETVPIIFVLKLVLKWQYFQK